MHRIGPPRNERAPEETHEGARFGPAGEQQRVGADDWAEEASRQARQLDPASAPATFGEFRRKLASGEALSRALVKLAEALRFSGRITITFHQGKLTKTAVEEAYYPGRPAA